MPVTAISDRCLQIRRFGFINCYLLREDDGLTLIDTAIGAARIIVQAGHHMGQPVRRILLTHAHADHVGSVDMLSKLLPEAEVMIGERESQLLAEAASGTAKSKMKLLPGEPQVPIQGGFKKVVTKPSRLLHENDRIGFLRVVSTPGHTPGHLAFLDERDGFLYAGDALCTFSEIRLPFDPAWYFPLVKGASWHYPTALQSVESLVDQRIERVLAGHGPVRQSSRTALQHAIERARRKT